MLNPPVNGKIQGLFKAFECFSSTFQGKFNFQGLFKTVLYIQVLFKPVPTLYYKFNDIYKRNQGLLYPLFRKKNSYTRFFVRKIGYINFVPKSVRRPSVRLSVRPCVTFLVIVSSPKPLAVAT